MTAIELDPVFVRALRLLHSKSKDSTSQLKSMLDEAIRHRKGLGPGPTGFGPSSPQQRKRDREGNGIPRKDADKRYSILSVERKFIMFGGWSYKRKVLTNQDIKSYENI